MYSRSDKIHCDDMRRDSIRNYATLQRMQKRTAYHTALQSHWNNSSEGMGVWKHKVQLLPEKRGRWSIVLRFILRWGCAQTCWALTILLCEAKGPKCMRRVKHFRVDVPYMWKFEFCRRTQMLMYAYIADVRNWFKLKRFYLGQDNNLGKSISPMVDEIWQPHILGELGDIPIHPCRCYSMTKIILKARKARKARKSRWHHTVKNNSGLVYNLNV